MSFYNKKINAAKFKLETVFELEKIKANLELFAAPKLNTVNEEIVTGWSCAEDPTSVDFSECIIAEKYLYTNMRIAVKKLPAGLFKMMLAQKMAEYKKLNNKSFVPSTVKKELKEEVKESLLPKIAPTVKNVWVIFTDEGDVFAGTTSAKEKQLLTELVFKTTDQLMVEQSLELFLKEIPSFLFMTDIFKEYDQFEAGNRIYCVHSPYTLLASDESTCDVIGLSGSNVDDSPELQIALKEGKEFKKIRLSASAGLFEKHLVSGFVDENDIFTFTIEPDGSLIGVVLPECDTVEGSSLFVERVELLKSLFQLVEKMAVDFAERYSVPLYEELKQEWAAER